MSLDVTLNCELICLRTLAKQLRIMKPGTTVGTIPNGKPIKLDCDGIVQWKRGIAYSRQKCGTENRRPYLSDKSLGSRGAHEQHSSAQRVAVAVQLFHTHGSEQAGDHHVDV